MSIPYRIRSVNTSALAISTTRDMADQEVDTKPGNDSIPDDSVLFTDVPIIKQGVTIVEIFGVSPNRLYVSLKEEADKTKLTWSYEKYSWVIASTGSGSYIITPANAADLYWFDEFNVGVGNHIEVRQITDLRTPQNEWVIDRA